MKKWLKNILAGLLALAVLFLIARRVVPVSLSALLPEMTAPEKCTVHSFDWADGREVTGEALDTLLRLLESLSYRYTGRAPGGVMKGQLYHLSFFQSAPVGLYYVYVSNQLGIVYVNDLKYEMLGDPQPLLDFLASLK